MLKKARLCKPYSEPTYGRKAKSNGPLDYKHMRQGEKF